MPILERASFTASMMPLLEKVAPAAASTSVDCAAMMASGMVSKAGSETPAVSPWDCIPFVGKGRGDLRGNMEENVISRGFRFLHGLGVRKRIQQRGIHGIFAELM